MCDYDHVTIYWLPSNGAITQCGRKAHAIKAGRTSRVQQEGGGETPQRLRIQHVHKQDTDTGVGGNGEMRYVSPTIAHPEIVASLVTHTAGSGQYVR